MTTKPPYGTYHLDTEPCVAAWGARLIYDGTYGMVYDRQGATGDEQHVAELIGKLNGEIDPIKILNDSVPYDGRSEDKITVYEDDDVLIVGSPQGSHGYFYVTAVLKG